MTDQIKECSPTGFCQYQYRRGAKMGQLCNKPAPGLDQILCDNCSMRKVSAGRYRVILKSEMIARTFALVVFLSDGFLSVENSIIHQGERRFFRILQELPMELQMVICHRIYGSVRNIILSKNSEEAFRKLAKSF